MRVRARKYKLEIGDHAISEQIVPCWECRYCKMGAYWMCAVHDIYGFHRRTFGSWAEFMLFPSGALNYKVPKTMPLHHAVFIEPLACSIHAVERGNIQFQDTVVIAGCGPLGLGMVAAAKMRGAARIVALDLSDERGQGRRGLRRGTLGSTRRRKGRHPEGARPHRRLRLRRFTSRPPATRAPSSRVCT